LSVSLYGDMAERFPVTGQPGFYGYFRKMFNRGRMDIGWFHWRVRG